MTENTVTEPSMEDQEYRKALLKQASDLGISVHPNAKNETIAAKITAVLKDKPEETVEAPTVAEEAPAPVAPVRAAKASKELHPAKRLVRVRITCNDPQKADQSGDIISVSNAVVGNVRFYFHFNKPWHVPQFILDTLRESKLFLHSSRKDGREIVTREVPRYNIEVLPPLDEKQRERIAAKQAAALASED